MSSMAAAHLAALEYNVHERGCEPMNIGTGHGVTVKEIVASYERACGQRLLTEYTDRRPGDVASRVAASAKAEKLLGWRSERDLESMCRSSWRRQCVHPAGYDPIG